MNRSGQLQTKGRRKLPQIGRLPRWTAIAHGRIPHILDESQECGFFIFDSGFGAGRPVASFILISLVLLRAIELMFRPSVGEPNRLADFAALRLRCA